MTDKQPCKPLVSDNTNKDDVNIQNPVSVPTEKIPMIRWTNRRRMAWTAIISMIIFTIALLFLPAIKIVAISNIATPFYISMSSIIAAYMGFTTLPLVIGKRRNKVRINEGDY